MALIVIRYIIFFCTIFWGDTKILSLTSRVLLAVIFFQFFILADFENVELSSKLFSSEESLSLIFEKSQVEKTSNTGYFLLALKEVLIGLYYGLLLNTFYLLLAFMPAVLARYLQEDLKSEARDVFRGWFISSHFQYFFLVFYLVNLFAWDSLLEFSSYLSLSPQITSSETFLESILKLLFYSSQVLYSSLKLIIPYFLLQGLIILFLVLLRRLNLYLETGFLRSIKYFVLIFILFSSLWWSVAQLQKDLVVDQVAVMKIS